MFCAANVPLLRKREKIRKALDETEKAPLLLALEWFDLSSYAEPQGECGQTLQRNPIPIFVLITAKENWIQGGVGL